MRISMAYFAGAGTVMAAIAAGLGGGVLMGNIMSPHGTREISKIEQRAAALQAQPSPQVTPLPPNAAPIAASNGAPAPVPYLAATQQATTTPVVVAPAAERTASNESAAKPQVASTSPPPQAAALPAVRQPSPNPDNAYAKARDADLQDKRKAERAERRQQWMARHQHQREQEQRDVEREDAEPREIIVRRDDFDRPDFAPPVRFGFPRINLLGPD